MKRTIGLGCTFLLLVTVLLAQTVNAASQKLSMLPRYSSEEINKRVKALSEYLSLKTRIPIEPMVTANFSQYQKGLLSGTIAIGYENPYIYVLTSHEHEVVAMAVKGKNGDRFRGIVITRADSPLRSLEDLVGKTISIVGQTSAGGYLSQKLSMLRLGIDVERQCNIVEAVDNKQENVILSVFTGDADAGFIRESALNHIDKYIPPSQIKLLTATAWLPNWALSVKRTLPEENKDKIRRALLEIPSDHPLLTILKIKGFKEASDRDYDPVRQAAGFLTSADDGVN